MDTTIKRTLWLRSEPKPFEERVALIPSQAKELLEQGHTIFVEEDDKRIFPISDYKNAGCIIKPQNSWIEHAPQEATILGLKELQELKNKNGSTFPFTRRHIHFAHLFKGQTGCEKTLKRFKEGNGLLFDLEYLTDEKGKRVAAFGPWAGFIGAALGLDLWLCQKNNINMNQRGRLKSYPNKHLYLQEMKEKLKDQKPKILVIGPRGRCGQGASRFFDEMNLSFTSWGREETEGKNSIKEILDYEIVINCILVNKPVGKWLTPEMIDGSQNLRVLSDVSCDPTGPYNPMPVYHHSTSMDLPAYYYPSDKNFAITAIDHLPSLLPKESSIDFSTQLFPYLQNYMKGEISNGPWERALTHFYKNIYHHVLEDEDFKSHHFGQQVESIS